MVKTARIESQDRIVLAFLEKVAKRVERETEIKGWECFIDDEDPIDENDNGVYGIGNKSFSPSLIVEANVKLKESFVVYVYNHNPLFFENLSNIIQEELFKAAKELKITKTIIRV